MTIPEPMPDAIARRVAEVKSEFDLGGYFSDPAHTEKAERLLDALADQLRAALVGHPEPVTQQHRAEAWRVGHRFGWSCLDCTSKADDVIDATAAERGAEWHSLHPHGLTAPEPVTGATQDPRVAELLDILEGFCDEDRIRFVILERLDRADAAAGIRRVTTEAVRLVAYSAWEAGFYAACEGEQRRNPYRDGAS